MRAMTITDDHGLRLTDVPDPEPADGDVLVRVVAAGVNPADVSQVAGHYPPPPGASPLPGLEVSGHRLDTGEPVVALLAGGGYAELVAVPEAHVLPAPAGVPLADAAGLIEVAATVVSNLVIEGGLSTEASAADASAADATETDRQTVLVHGATGGIGSFAIPFASALGARVLATAGSDEAVRTALAFGADAAYNRRTTDVVAAVTEAGGADIVLDVAGGPALDDNVRMLREFGRLVVISAIAGRRGELDVGALMAKRARVIGTTLRSRGHADKARILARTHELVWPLLADGTLRVPVHARFPLAEAAAAHDVLRAGGHTGKVLLDVGA